ncbi:hypothetical protein Adt_23911 [Abeliophyllum distichum]|uniref:Uncharacterized protein n=1 Tax=Abeliophyllum distichum TaxID=126358 RepID=A0ABD1SD06_9LAMI
MANLIYSCGWQVVASKPHLAYPLLVKEFLANFNHAIEEPEADHQMECHYFLMRSPRVPNHLLPNGTLGNPVARRAVDNLNPIPAVETDRLLRQIFTQLSEQGRVLNSIQRTQLAMQRTVDHMRIEIGHNEGIQQYAQRGATDYKLHIRRCQPPNVPVCAAHG